MTLRHIAGKTNQFADYLSRHMHPLAHLEDSFSALSRLLRPKHASHLEQMFSLNNLSPSLLFNTEYNLPVSTMMDLLLESPPALSYADVRSACASASKNLEDFALHQLTNRQVFDSVHGGRNFHKGLARTMALLDNKYPGHGIPSSVVADWIASCKFCQKYRLGSSTALRPMTKAFDPEHAHSCVSADGLEIGPDEYGNRYLMVFVNLLTKHTKFYATRDKTAETLAMCMLQYACTFGYFEEFRSDPGSDFTSAVVAQLNLYLGQNHVVTHVARPQANGVERTNGKILYYLRAITSDLKFRARWSSPMVLSLAEYMVNTDSNSETEVTPFRNTFGTLAEIYAKLPRGGEVTDRSDNFIKLLDSDLEALMRITKAVKVKHSEHRARHDPAAQNLCQPGDYVLIELADRPHKLLHKWAGPKRVISQEGNDVTLLDLVTNLTTREHCGKLKRFAGTEEDAVSAARLDNDQILIDKILAFKGEPTERSQMQFLVQFVDGDKVWRAYDKDISETIQFQHFCEGKPALEFLLVSARDAKIRMAAIKRAPIDLVKTGDLRFADLRSWSTQGWFDSLNLPHASTKTYVVRCVYGALQGSRISPRKSVSVHCPVFDTTWPADNCFVTIYGHQHGVLTENFIEVDEALIQEFPAILDN